MTTVKKTTASRLRLRVPGAGAIPHRRLLLPLLLPPLLLLFVARLAWRSFLGTGPARPPPPPPQATAQPAVAYDPPDVAADDAAAGEGGGSSSDPYALARSQSHGFFYDVPPSHWRRLRTIFAEHQDHRYPEDPWTHHPSSAGGWIEWAWKSYRAGTWMTYNYEPNFSCQFEKRVGVPMNGAPPNQVCDPHRIEALAKARRARDPSHPGCIVYSIGSNGDFTFELGVEKEAGAGVCEFHIFDMGDYEKKMMSQGLQRAFYHRWGIKGAHKSNKGNKFHSLQDTVRLLGHESLDIVDIFKIDCEHCEWDSYRDWLSPGVPLLHQILVEVHKAPRLVALDFFGSLERAGYLRFHKEPNIQYEPSCVEYAFVKVGQAFVEGKGGSNAVTTP
ncbi:hypothetical protein ACHAWF_002207 [Thalassiosira exigua]